MKRLIAYALILIITGCSTCNKVTVYEWSDEHQANVPVEREVCKESKFKWYDVLLFPVFVLAAVGGGAGELAATQRAVTDSPHYQAGGDSYVDYTKK